MNDAHLFRSNNHDIVVHGRSTAFRDGLNGEVTVIAVRSKHLLWEPVVRGGRGEIQVNFRGTLPVTGGRTETGYHWGLGSGERWPLLGPRALVVWLDFRGRRRWGAPEGSIE